MMTLQSCTRPVEGLRLRSLSSVRVAELKVRTWRVGPMVNCGEPFVEQRERQRLQLAEEALAELGIGEMRTDCLFAPPVGPRRHPTVTRQRPQMSRQTRRHALE